MSGIWKELAISPRHAALLLPAILLSLLSHQLTFFFLFSLSVYCIVQAAWYLYRNDAHKFRNKYFYLSILLIPALFLMLAPMGHSIVRMMLSPILSSDQIVWALPNWDTILKQWESERYAAFLVYNDVFRYDAGFLYFTGLAGLAGAWLWNRNSALWLCSMLVVPMLLLSFVYRDPSVQRYIIFVHPFFWIASAVFFYMVWKWASPFFSRKTQFIFLLIPFILILANAKWKEIGTLALGSQKSGFVVNPKIGGLNFTNWKDVCEYVSTHRQPDEIIMATVSNGVSYYLDDKNVLAFRQASYDTQKKQQVYNQPKLDGVKNAGSYDDLVYTVNNTPRGWLLADYYLESSYVDERARQFVYQNMHFIPEASSDGDVMLFRWDNSVPKPENQNLVVELGRTPSKVSSRITNINIPDELINANNLKLVVRSSNVDSKEEAFIVFNNQFPVFLPINKTNSIESHTLNIDKKILKRGNNTIQVGYNPKIKQDPRNGFALYYFNLTAQ